MSDSAADQIAKLKQTIATLEEQQRTLGVDLSLSLNQMRELLAQLEQAGASESPSFQSGEGRTGIGQLDAGWGMRLNQHDLFQWKRSGKLPDGCPAWVLGYQIEDWGNRGLVVWNNETRQLHRLGAESALKYLDKLRASDEWRTNGIIITRTVRHHKSLPSPSRQRSRKKQKPIKPAPSAPEKPDYIDVEEECVRLGSSASQDLFVYLQSHEATLREMADEDKKEHDRLMNEVLGFFLKAARRKQADEVELSTRPMQWTRSEHELEFVCDRPPNRATIKPAPGNYAWQACIERPDRFKHESLWFFELEKVFDWAEGEMLAAEQESAHPEEADEEPVLTLSTIDLTLYWIEPTALEPAQITYRVVMFIDREPIEFKTKEMSFGKLFKYDKEFPGPQALTRELGIDSVQMAVEQLGRDFGLYQVRSNVAFFKESLAAAQAQAAWDRCGIIKAFQEGKIIRAYYGYEEMETGYKVYLGGCQKPEAIPHNQTSRAEYMTHLATRHSILNAGNLDAYRAHLGIKKKYLSDEKLLVMMHEDRAESPYIPQTARVESQQWLQRNANLVKQSIRQRSNH